MKIGSQHGPHFSHGKEAACNAASLQFIRPSTGRRNFDPMT
jgi:hypothetical protein